MDEYIKKETAKYIVDHEGNYVNSDDWFRHSAPISEAIDNYPAADVVDVVRCKDCKYAPTGDGHGFSLEWPDQELYRCPFMCEDGWYSRKPRPDFFCANGERREHG